MGGPGKTADLANELERSVVDLRIGGWRLEIEKGSNIPAHSLKHGAGTAGVKPLIVFNSRLKTGASC